MKYVLAACAGLLLLSACASDAPPAVKQEADTSPKINLDVLTVEILDRSSTLATTTPYTTNNFQPTIGNALRRWATEKLSAVGSTGDAIFVIRDASLKSEPLHHADSIFTREQTSKYVGHVEVELDVMQRDKHGQVTVEASQFVTLPETPSTLERQNAYNSLLNALMRDFNGNLRTGIRNHLGNFVVGAPGSP